MGTWDPTSFGNDTSNDWAYDLEECSDLSYIERALQKVIDAQGGNVGARLAEEAIAAAEVLAWLLGRPSKIDAYTKKIATWVAANPIAPANEISSKALAVLERILQPPSELLDLWEGDPRWLVAMQDLRSRLKQGASSAGR